MKRLALARRSLLFAATVLVAAASCGQHSEDSCDPSVPGFRFVVHFDIAEAWEPVELSVVYSNQSGDSFDSQIPHSPWADPLVFCVPYGPNAVDGPARATFRPRPENIGEGVADVIVDVSQRIDVEMTVVEVSTADAGL